MQTICLTDRRLDFGAHDHSDEKKDNKTDHYPRLVTRQHTSLELPADLVSAAVSRQ